MSRPGVLLVTAPGATRERLAVETELRRRGWPQVPGPASADLVVFAGAPVPVREDSWAERLWLGVPEPKARVTVADAEHAAHALDHGHARLLTPERRAAEPAELADEGGHEHGHGHHGHGEGHEHHPSPEEHGSHDRQGGHEVHEGHHDGHHEHGDQGGMDHGHHGRHMGEVADLPMAERADDRDGLRLDRLHVPLGPVLPDWPAGLVLLLELQGDVVQHAEVEQVSAPRTSRPAFWNEPWVRAAAGAPVTIGEAARRRCAAHLDSLGRFLGVAGWRDASAKARHARDQVLGSVPVTELRPAVTRLVRRVRRSRTLRWLTAGVGELSAEHAYQHRVTGPALLADGDVHDRVSVWLDEIEHALDACDDPGPLASRSRPLVAPRGRLDTGAAPSRSLLDVLPGLLQGAEFACARLIVASLDPDLDELAQGHGPEAHAHA
ncbi:hypothetical protein OG304_04500 [Streptomyces sp. NBC_00160]|uniref:hypothetical protein n=1 Tax=Streptomyces sp. NBC_00160 TaxID=2903628 RepID=UPI0022542E72|nr:hypothetical protein [Streptomyces sp. NBC_00160]MCX5302712.1 hypothetical protein [Streptomyces sp. NBC_00160]